jgi:hypothetical protein
LYLHGKDLLDVSYGIVEAIIPQFCGKEKMGRRGKKKFFGKIL